LSKQEKADSPYIMDIPCVMLAAGKSERMGQWKMSMKWESSTIIETSVTNALTACSSVTIVSGWADDELSAIFKAPAWREYASRISIVKSDTWQCGMFASARSGFAGLPETETPDSDWCFLALGDMPQVTPETYLQSASFAEAEGRAESIIPQYRGKKGHPVLLSRGALEYALKLTDNDSMRDVISAFPSLIFPVKENGILNDIDTPEDYRKYNEK